jgi:hypothetical protein
MVKRSVRAQYFDSGTLSVGSLKICFEEFCNFKFEQSITGEF